MSRETISQGIRISSFLPEGIGASVLDCSPHPTLIMNQRGIIEYANDALTTMWGFHVADQIVGIDARDLWNSRDTIDHIMQSSNTAGPESLTKILDARHRRGNTFPVEVVARSLKDWPNGSNRIAVFVTYSDSQLSQLRQDLNESTRLLAETQEIAKIGNWDLDLRRNVLTWSERVFDIFEVSPEKFDGTYEYFLDLVFPEDRGLVNNSFLESLDKARCYEVTHRIQTSSGSIKWVNERCQVFIDCDGQPVRCLGTVRDVTAQVETQRALQVANSQLRSIIDSHSGFVGLLDLEGRLIEINAAPFKSHLANRQEVLGKSLWETKWFAHSKSTRRQIRTAIQQVVEGRSLRFEIAICKSENELITHDISFEPMLDSEGHIINVAAYAVDISQRKQAEELLRESECFTRSTLDALSAEIAVLDEVGVISHVNRAWTEFTIACCTYWHTAPKGANYLELCRKAGTIGIKAASRLAQGIDDILNGQCTEFCVEHCCQTANGQQWFLSRGTRYPGGERVVIVHADITSVKMAESQMEELRNQLVHASRIATMGEMAAGIAHELNQPLAAIRLYAEGGVEGLDKDTLDGPALSVMLDNIGGLATRCGQVIRGLREFARREEPRHVILDVRDMIHEVLQFMGHECRCSGVNYDLDLGNVAQLVMANPIQLQQVLVNLIRNAIEALAGQNRLGRIEIRSRGHTGDRQITISVHDNGPGMSMETKSHLFAPFFTTKPSGLGMGLKISQTILRAHGGTIACTSEPEDGTTFTIRLPMASNLKHD